MVLNRFLLLVGILSLLLVSLAVASLLATDPEPVDTSWPPRPDYSDLHDQPLRPSLSPTITNATPN
jgi:hypothetical protein